MSDQKRPRQVSCGCCTGGCICHFHQDISRGVRAETCAYHREHPHTHQTEEYDPGIHIPQ